MVAPSDAIRDFPGVDEIIKLIGDFLVGIEGAVARYHDEVWFRQFDNGSQIFALLGEVCRVVPVDVGQLKDFETILITVDGFDVIIRVHSYGVGAA